MESPHTEQEASLENNKINDEGVVTDEEPSSGKEIFIDYGNNKIVRISLENHSNKETVVAKNTDPLEFVLKAANFTAFYFFILFLLLNKAFGISETITQNSEEEKCEINQVKESTTWKGFLSNIIDIYILMFVKTITAVSSISVYSLAVVIEVFIKQDEAAPVE
ncbi:hypothetical protein DSO57_1033958 [Entomophthora muscae]|uniref:Uncharacterized protein n=1 Tax=Entomophthora muscae TaxID=34485 RepID=A0ACC2UAD5_9FUNG|nr:hypothetical protein DSO57_1033958 [Entomophthora muscae]